MPTIITHALLPLIAATAFKPGLISRRLAGAGALAAILPDGDVIGFRLGIPYGADLGHRGASHSLLFAMLFGAIAASFAPQLGASRWKAFLFVGLAAASHGLTDMLTSGGRGVALWWPLTSERLFWPVRPVEVSPIGIRGLADGSLVNVLESEFLWLIMPAAIIAILFGKLVVPHIDLTGGRS